MTTPPNDDPDVFELLEGADMKVLGLLPYSSNYTFLVELGADAVRAVYKPQRGETPLWDFEHGSLAAREVAAYVVSEGAGVGLVPPTVLRGDAQMGPGSVQLFVPHDPNVHYFILLEEGSDEVVEILRTIAVFDCVINNADRKSGHVLRDADGRLWAVDHGVSFHVDPKLRTVIWDFAGEPLGETQLEVLHRLEHEMAEGAVTHERLARLLTPEEVSLTRDRVKLLLQQPVFPEPNSLRPYPWPLV